MVSEVADLASWPKDDGVPGEPFCLLLLTGEGVLEDREAESFASRALRQGMVYLSVWCTESEWIEDVVDQIDVGLTISGEIGAGQLVTTSHSDLDEALDFFEHDVRPSGEPHARLWWVVSVGNRAALAVAIRRLRADHRVERLRLG